MDYRRDANLNEVRARPPEHVLKAIRTWAMANDFVASVYGVGSRFTGVTNDRREIGEADDLDLVVVLRLMQAPPSYFVEAWRSKLSIVTAFHIDLHLHKPGSDWVREHGYQIFQREWAS